jgi:MFS family permease
MGAQAIGFAAALLLGGALTEYGPWPTRLCFWILAVLLLILLIGTWLLPRHAAGGVVGDWRSRIPSVSKDVRRAFAMSSTAMMAAYTFGVLVLSLGGQVEHDLIGSPNVFLNSAVLSLFPIVMGAIGIVARTLSPRVALIVGALVSSLAMVLLILAVNFRDLVIYLLATAAAGGAYSLLFVGGLQVISTAAPERNRGGILSALYLLGYLSMGALALVLVPHRALPDLQRMKLLLFCGRVVGTEVGILLVRISPRISWTRGSWSTSDCRHGLSSAPEHVS